MKTIALIFGIMMLCGCALESPQSISDRFTIHRDSAFGYLISAPHDFDMYGWDGRVTVTGKTSEHALWNGKKNSLDEVTVDVFNLSSSCSPDVTGLTSESVSPLPNTGGKTLWGKEPRPSPYGYSDALCRTMVTTLTKTEYWQNTGIERSAAYVLCSEKDGKTVVICITQMTDNPAIAKQIFETFRWTK